MKVLGLIPARGGSKGVPRKNIKMLNGKPLMQYTTEAALQSKKLTKVVLSTDDEEIAEVGKRLGLQVPFMRPAELAQDSTPTLPVVQHMLLRLMEAGETFDAVMLLQTTSPLRTAEDIDTCIELMERNNYDTVLSVKQVPHQFNPHWVFMLDENGMLKLSTGDKQPISRRQDLPLAYFRDGSIYLTQTSVVLNEGTLYGETVFPYLTRHQSLNIDTLEDWKLAEQIMGSGSKFFKKVS